MRKLATLRLAKSVALIATLALAATSPANAQSPAAPLVCLNIPPDDEAIGQALQRMDASHCTTNECAALATIAKTLEIFLQANVTPTGLGGWTSFNIRLADRETRPSLVRKRLQTTLLDHPEQFPAICARIASMISLFDGDKTQFDNDYITIIDLYQAAVLIDARKPQHCLSRAIAALSPEADRRAISYDYDLIDHARDECMTDQWRIKACNLIRRPTNR